MTPPMACEPAETANAARASVIRRRVQSIIKSFRKRSSFLFHAPSGRGNRSYSKRNVWQTGFQQKMAHEKLRFLADARGKIVIAIWLHASIAVTPDTNDLAAQKGRFFARPLENVLT
jgi:hypothetical protein